MEHLILEVYTSLVNVRGKEFTTYGFDENFLQPFFSFPSFIFQLSLGIFPQQALPSWRWLPSGVGDFPHLARLRLRIFPNHHHGMAGRRWLPLLHVVTLIIILTSNEDTPHKIFCVQFFVYFFCEKILITCWYPFFLELHLHAWIHRRYGLPRTRQRLYRRHACRSRLIRDFCHSRFLDVVLCYWRFLRQRIHAHV